MDWRVRRPSTPATVTLLLAATLLAVAMGLALRGDPGGGGTDRVGLAAGGGVTVSCPSVEDALAGVDIPAASEAGVAQELANLERQIANVNARLAREPDQAASQAGDIRGKRHAVIERIVLDIERVGGDAPDDLGELAECEIVNGDAGAGGDAGGDDADGADGADAGAGDGADAGAGDGADDGADDGGAVAAQRVSCPGLADALPEVPASARAEVTRNLALLQRQIAEADARLARLAERPEGGPNFVQNAILGPLEDKRSATLERIAISIGRTADRPEGLETLAPCTAVG
jgi:hypothetical protein